MNLLIEALSTLPSDWQLVPVVGKRPIAGRGWNHRGRSPSEMVDWIHSLDDCTGFGLLTGIPIDRGNSYIFAVDQDGDVAGAILRHLPAKRETTPTPSPSPLGVPGAASGSTRCRPKSQPNSTPENFTLRFPRVA